jgi:selenocysteine-specific elongation factor
LAILCPFDEKKLEKALQDLLAQKRCILYDKENKIYLADCYVKAYEQTMLQKVREYHQNEPLKQYMPKASLLSQFEPAKLAQSILNNLLKQKKLLSIEDGLCVTNHTVSLTTKESTIKKECYDFFLQNPHNPPLLKELCEKFSVSQKEMLNVLALLVQEEKLVKVMEGMYFLRAEIEQIKQAIFLFFQNNSDMSPNDFKTISQGLTRKYAIPVLEYFDKERMTIRVGNGRKLRQINK